MSNKKILIVMCGFSSSDKTEKADGIVKRELKKSSKIIPIVSLSAIRKSYGLQSGNVSTEDFITTTAKYMISTLFSTGYDSIIIDGCNITVSDRARWVSSNWVREFIFVDTPLNICRKKVLLQSTQSVFNLETEIKQLQIPSQYNEYTFREKHHHNLI